MDRADREYMDGGGQVGVPNPAVSVCDHFHHWSLLRRRLGGGVALDTHGV